MAECPWCGSKKLTVMKSFWAYDFKIGCFVREEICPDCQSIIRKHYAKAKKEILDVTTFGDSETRTIEGFSIDDETEK